MAFSRALPNDFREALQLAARLLSRNHELVEKNLIPTESEQIVLAAYRKATGKLLSRIELHTRLDDRYSEAAGQTLIIIASARSEGKLLQHLLGYQTFLDHEYEVGPAVLVPRPETEFLVTLALDELGRQFPIRGQPFQGLEIGVGSGAISIELLSRFPGLQILASEISAEAEAIARTNSRRILNHVGGDSARLKILRAQHPLHVWEPFSQAQQDHLLPASGAQFLISNPPYLLNTPAEVDAEVLTHEPPTALFAPADDPLYFYRKIAQQARDFLDPSAWIFVEIPHERAHLIEALFAREGWKIRLSQDLHGRDRILSAKL